jgi:hypothetical protein
MDYKVVVIGGMTDSPTVSEKYVSSRVKLSKNLDGDKGKPI